MAKQNPKLHELFSQLHQTIVDEDFEDTVKCANKILAVVPDEVDAFKCKIIAFIQMNKYTDALSAISSYKDRASFSFEEVYCLHRLRKYREALTFLETAPQEKKFFELKAQVFYSLEMFSEAATVYETLVQKHGSSTEMLVNLCAAYVKGGSPDRFKTFFGQNQKLMRESHEFAYNIACATISQGDLKTALEYLELALATGKTTLTCDGFSEEAIAGELAPIQTQIGYVKQRLGNAEEALKIYTQVAEGKKVDQSTRAVLTNNTVTLRDGERANSYRNLTKLQTEEFQSKLTKVQKEAIAFNLALLLIQMNKVEECKELIKKMTQEFPTNDLLTLISASLLQKEKKVDQSKTLLEDFAAKHPESSARTRLCIAQMYLTQNNIPMVIKTLEEINQSLRNTPAVIATLVSLYEGAGNTDGALAVLDGGLKILNKTADYYPVLLQKTADYKLKFGKFQDAAKMFRQLLDLRPSDRGILSSLVAAYSQFDPVAAKKVMEKIPEEEEGEGVNAEELENLAVPRGIQKKKEKQAVVGKTPAAIQKKKKKRKNKPPKKTMPGQTIDPERWLPKFERSSYKGKRRGKVTGNKGAQGSVSASAAVLKQEGVKIVVPQAEVEVNKGPLKGAAGKQQAAAQKAEVDEAVKAAIGGKPASSAGRGGGARPARARGRKR